MSSHPEKAVRDGTHRTVPPEETLRRVAPHLQRIGITRIADITGLDHIGIPVWQACRPMSTTLSVSQGKGLTDALAKASAVMESIELWHAETAPAGLRSDTAEGLGPQLTYDPARLPLAYGSLLTARTRLDWVPAQPVLPGDGRPRWLPYEAVRLDGTVRDRWAVPLFRPSTNGLASGNTLEEALLHGLLEVAERDALASDGERVPILPGSVGGYPGELVKRFADARVSLRIEDIGNVYRLPCFKVLILSHDFPVVFRGSGCHVDSDVALSRALTEAAQSRLTAIAGARDDLPASVYTSARISHAGIDARAARWAAAPRTPYTRRDDSGASVRADIDVVATRLRARTRSEPLYVDHTRPDLGIPVVHVVVPGTARKEH
ncbi:YcaO-like family protein [Nonomuraea sp. PA05]|uniref:YcaO-like family protein n=1 Tax=Nonomuraea sp. PA05 TaxID=2604466 RepID=UPI0016528A41|nr:YcaO-like family protein [Nonomuraea sp. PA05]